MADISPKIWGPIYWNFLHIIAHHYPTSPNDVIKKKYYNLISQLPYFIPHSDSSIFFEELLNQYPVANYLSSKKTLVQWVHFIHNQLNVHTNKTEMTLDEHYLQFSDTFYPPDVKKPIYPIMYKVALLMVISGLLAFALIKGV